MAADSGGPSVAGPGVNTAVLEAFELFIDAVADGVSERLERRRGRMINQHESELGPRRHREAVKRRLENGEGGAGRAGRNYLLTKEAIREELAGKGGRGRGKGASGAPVPSGGDGSPGAGSSGAKSRTRELNDFEREVMSGLRAVKETGR